MPSAILSKNAITHTPRHSEVCVEVERDGSVSVVDRQRVFQRFWRGKGASSSGAGLSLANVKEIADAHHATVSIDDNPSGQGTIFTIRFLFAVDRPPEAALAEAAST
jgi:two-component system sensor histidine kinase TctE